MKFPSFVLLLALAVPVAAQKIKVKTKPGAPPVLRVVPVPPVPERPTSSPIIDPPFDAALRYATEITAERLRTHLAVLASDAYEGRETGEKGQHLAANYVATQFKAAGLTGPVAANAANPYLQPFQLEHLAWDANPTLTVGKTTYKWLVDFYGRGDAGFDQETLVQPVFVGYGIEQPGYSDYAGKSVAGKDLLILEGEPAAADGTAALGTGGEASKWGRDYRAKAALAAAKGARSVFFVNFEPNANFAKYAARLAPALAKPSIVLAGEKPDRAPSFFVSPAVGYALLGRNAAAVQAYLGQVNAAGKPVPARFKLAKLKVKAAKVRTPFGTENALGFVEGSDRKAEVLVISAHHDHLGVIDGQVYNGADDDGSGTAAIITLAEAFARAKAEGHGPRRSLLFLSVTGEEEGLYGSEYYAGHPVFDLKNTVADLNVDMVGRTDDAHHGKADYVYVIGSDKLASQLKVSVEAMNTRYTHLDLDYRFDDPADPNRFYYRSDHYNFAVKKIPVAFFFNGVHEDYHQASDEIEKIQFDKLEGRARLVFFTAWDVANAETRLVVDSARE